MGGNDVNRWLPLTALALAQFVMVLDQAVMNVSISQLVEDFETNVTTIQGVITLYSLVMAMFMLVGAKIGDIVGRRRAFIIGLVIYAFGSGLTAASWSVASLTLGWSILEGLGAALVLPALAALIAGNYEGKDRVTAYAIIGGVAGAGIAVGPIVGGWATTMISWRIVFVGEVILVLIILALVRYVTESAREGRKPSLDVVGAALSATGLGLIVFGILQSSSWGFVYPVDPPFTILGFSPVVFVIGAGVGLLYAFVRWSRRREAHGLDPLFRLDLLKIGTLRSGLASLLSQNLVLMGIFFVIPLYLQLVLGLNALETGIRMLPVSVAMFIASAAGSRLVERYSVRRIIRTGFIVVVVACVFLMSAIEPTLEGLVFASAMALLGVGMGLLASQLGNVVQSSVDASGRSEAGGLQFTSQQLGSAVGVALVGAVVIAGLTASFVSIVSDDERIPTEVVSAVTIEMGDGAEMVASEDLAAALEETSLEAEIQDALVEDYEAAQLQALRTGLLVSAIVALAALMFTRELPSRRPEPAATGPEAEPETA
jgi:MFS family permease